MDREFIEYEVDGPVAVITLNRPDRRNAQHMPLLKELDAAWSEADGDGAVRVIVLKANGPHFSAGHDLTVTRDKSGGDVDFKAGGLEALYRFECEYFIGYSRRWRDIPKPSIAAVQGACIAAGLMLCWPCDLIVASEDAVFSDPVLRLGIAGVEYHGHTWELGPRKAKELLFTAEQITAGEAHRLGMVNRVVPGAELVSHTMELAHKISQMHPFALAQAKRAVNQTLDTMGQSAALQAAYDIHATCHGHALSVCGYPVMMDLDQMKAANKAESGARADSSR